MPMNSYAITNEFSSGQTDKNKSNSWNIIISHNACELTLNNSPLVFETVCTTMFAFFGIPFNLIAILLIMSAHSLEWESLRISANNSFGNGCGTTSTACTWKRYSCRGSVSNFGMGSSSIRRGGILRCRKLPPDSLCLVVVCCCDAMSLLVVEAFNVGVICYCYESAVFIVQMLWATIQSFAVSVECYMSVARCFALLFPHHTRRVLTIRRTRIALISIAVFILLNIPLHILDHKLRTLHLIVWFAVKFIVVLIRIIIPILIQLSTTIIIVFVIVREKRRFIYLHGALVPRENKKRQTFKLHARQELCNSSLCNITGIIFSNENVQLIQGQPTQQNADSETPKPTHQLRRNSLNLDTIVPSELLQESRPQAQLCVALLMPSRTPTSTSSVRSSACSMSRLEKRRMSTPNVHGVSPLRPRSSTLGDVRRNGATARTSNRPALLSTITIIVLLKNLSQLVCGFYYQVRTRTPHSSFDLIHKWNFRLRNCNFPFTVKLHILCIMCCLLIKTR